MSKLDAAATHDLGEEDIPLPPEHIQAEMIAADEAKDSSRASDAPAAASPKATRPRPEVAALKFVDPEKRARSVDLDFPFELDGDVVSAITVRRLNGFEIAAFARDHVDDEGEYDRYELYAAMSGLPAAVLRGLDQDDGLKVAGACSGFLSRALQGAS